VDAAPTVDSGTPPPPSCSFYGQGCSTAGGCCAGLVCVQSGTRTACAAGSTCVCTQLID
jgi:hypothetical protein